MHAVTVAQAPTRVQLNTLTTASGKSRPGSGTPEWPNQGTHALDSETRHSIASRLVDGGHNVRTYGFVRPPPPLWVLVRVPGELGVRGGVELAPE